MLNLYLTFIQFKDYIHNWRVIQSYFDQYTLNKRRGINSFCSLLKIQTFFMWIINVWSKIKSKIRCDK